MLVFQALTNSLHEESEVQKQNNNVVAVSAVYVSLVVSGYSVNVFQLLWSRQAMTERSAVLSRWMSHHNCLELFFLYPRHQNEFSWKGRTNSVSLWAGEMTITWSSSLFAVDTKKEKKRKKKVYTVPQSVSQLTFATCPETCSKTEIRTVTFQSWIMKRLLQERRKRKRLKNTQDTIKYSALSKWRVYKFHSLVVYNHWL